MNYFTVDPYVDMITYEVLMEVQSRGIDEFAKENMLTLKN